ncbi:MAG: hypothetical protein EOO38_08520 [Cytophagaceae bacterium]|nr:MAG: hypothetical protein EOO38_08520 [Cytophagaceae bacterium]
MLLGLAGCDSDSRSPSKAPSTIAQDVELEKDVSGIETTVRLAAANKRIDALQSQVDALRVNPQTLDMTMLKQRLEALELVVYTSTNQDADTTTASASPSAKAATPDVKSTQVRKGSRESRVSRAATKAEAEAFSKGSN